MATALADSQPTIEIDTVAFEAGMQRIRAGVRDGMIHPDYGTITVQGRLLAERCQDLTPPQSKGQGEAAVKRDLMRIFYPLRAASFTDKRMQKMIRSDDRQAWDAASSHFAATSVLRNTKAIAFSEDWHTKNRVSRGRARGMGNAKRGPKENLGVVTLGQEAAKAMAYTKEVRQRVGWAKAGWNAGIIMLGGMVPQSWISRHSLKRGRMIDGRRDPDPWVRVINDTGWAKYGPNQKEGDRIIRNAVAARARDMQAYAEKMMKLAVEKGPSIPSGMFGA